MMNTQATQHPPSAIEVLSDVLLAAQDGSCSTDHEIAEAIASIWLPIFRTEQNFAMALDAVKISHDSDSTADLCDRYLNAMRDVK
jgi:DNA-binding IclR family transcriptional regulator